MPIGRKTVTDLPRIALGAVFILSAGAKGTDPVRFGRQIESVIGIFPETSTSDWIWVCIAAAVFLTLLEFLLGSFLITSCRIRETSIVTIILLIGFMIVNLRSYFSGDVNDCGCFGPLLSRSPGFAIIENLVLIALAGISALRSGLMKPKSNRTRVVMIGASVMWIAVFALSPPSWAAVRTGMDWKQTDGIMRLPTGANHLIWSFDPDCLRCLDQSKLVDRLTGDDRTSDVTAITSATPGRVNEFRIDFNPLFKIKRVPETEIRRIGIPLSSIVHIKNGKVTSVWRSPMEAINFLGIGEETGN